MLTQLEFRIRGQHISRAENVFVVEKSQNYLYANFEFITGEWQDLEKIAVFTKDGVSYKIILDADGKCRVPWEHLRSVGIISVSAYGVGEGENPVIATVNTADIIVAETGYVETADNEEEPTPSVVDQIIAMIADCGKNVDGGTYDDWKEGGE